MSTIVNVVVNVDRAASIRAGRAQFGRTVVQVDLAKLNAEQREVLAKAKLSSMEGFTLDAFDLVGYPFQAATEATEVAAVEVINAHIKAQAEKAARDAAEKAEHLAQNIKRVQEFIAKPIDQRIYGGAVQTPFVYPDVKIHADLAASFAAAKAEAVEELKRREAVLAERMRESEARLAAAEAAKLTALNDWITTNGTDVQKRRRAAGLMSDQEAIGLVRDAVFSPLSHMERFRKLKGEDVEVEDADEATDSQFEAMEAVKSLMPGAEVKLRKVTATESADYDDDAQVRIAHSMLVTVDWNGWELSRAYSA